MRLFVQTYDNLYKDGLSLSSGNIWTVSSNIQNIIDENAYYIQHEQFDIAEIEISDDDAANMLGQLINMNNCGSGSIHSLSDFKYTIVNMHKFNLRDCLRFDQQILDYSATKEGSALSILELRDVQEKLNNLQRASKRAEEQKERLRTEWIAMELFHSKSPSFGAGAPDGVVLGKTTAADLAAKNKVNGE